jgi:hypothetical protein
MFNEVVVNELVKLRNGIPTFNGYTKLHELVKVGIMYMVGDVPGIAKEQNRVQQNAKSFYNQFLCIMRMQYILALFKFHFINQLHSCSSKNRVVIYNIKILQSTPMV